MREKRIAERGLEARRAVRKAQRELTAFHQARLAALEGMAARGLGVLTVMLSAAALVCATAGLSSNEKMLIVFLSVVGAFAVVLPMAASARAKARQVDGDYAQEHDELFGGRPRIELMSWLLDRPKRQIKAP